MFLRENKKGHKVFVCGTKSLKNELLNYDVDIDETGENAEPLSADCLEKGEHEISVPADVSEKAKKALDRMLELGK